MNRTSIKHRVQNAIARTVLGGALLLPYETRVRFVGAVFSRVVAPLAGWRRRIRENLAHALPDMPDEEVERLVRRVPDNVGRMLIEVYSGREFLDHVSDLRFEGPGAADLERALAEGERLVLVTAHMGNYDACRGALGARGYEVGALYKPMTNPLFNKRYLAALGAIGKPLFPTNGRGIAELLAYLKSGGRVGIVCDVALRTAPLLTFFGQPTHTPLSAAEWSLEHGARMIPGFCFRREDGLSFRAWIGPEITGETPEEMMQAFNDLTEAQIRAHPDQWFWIHRRWKQVGDP